MFSRTKLALAVVNRPLSHFSMSNSRVIGCSQQYRHFGIIGDTITKVATNKLTGDGEKRFAGMLEVMLSGEKWSLRPWKKTIDDQLNSWIMYVPGMKDSHETKELSAFKDLLAVFSDQDLDNPTEITFKDKERIVRASGKSMDEVNKLLVNYKQTLIVQQWLQLKKSLGEPIPSTQQEMRRMQEEDTRIAGIAQKVMKGGKQKTGRGRGSPF